MAPVPNLGLFCWESGLPMPPDRAGLATVTGSTAKVLRDALHPWEARNWKRRDRDLPAQQAEVCVLGPMLIPEAPAGARSTSSPWLQGAGTRSPTGTWPHRL